jgi:hypothetical protein
MNKFQPINTKTTYKTEITCFGIECKFNTSYRTDYKRGYCKAGKCAISSKGTCLEKDTGSEDYE